MSEILSYEKFVENLRAYLLDALNLQEERIYFEAKDEEGMAQNGDRLFVECRVSSEGKEVCGIHTEELYEDYLDGVSVDKIGDTVIVYLSVKAPVYPQDDGYVVFNYYAMEVRNGV